MAPCEGEIENLSLAAAFDRACKELESSSSDNSSNVLILLEHCERLVSAAALFSSNEDKDDMVTSHLRYLLVPFMKAELLSNQPARAPTERLEQLQAAAAAYSEFLLRCHQYGFLSGACRDAYAAEEQGTQLDPGQSRTQKIERFKRSKAVDGLLQQLNSRKKRAADEDAGTEGGCAAGVGGWDEEDERLLWQLQLEAAALKALDARPMLQRETSLLQHAVQQQLEQPARDGPSSSSSASSSVTGAARHPDQAMEQQQQQLQQQMLDKLTGIVGQLSLSDKQALRQQVFRPSHTLPTMTVEQQGAIELRQAQERQRQADQAAAAARARQAEQRSDDEDEDELARARAWDDFKDDNPRGWGNSKLRPCA